MTSSKGFLLALSLAFLLGLWSSAALAESGPSPTGMSGSSDLPDDGWHYGTYYLYPLTRHLGESEISKPWSYGMLPFTVVLDTVQLPFGAIAGLFGD